MPIQSPTAQRFSLRISKCSATRELTIWGQRESRRSHVLSPPPRAKREETPSPLGKVEVEFEFVFGGRIEMGESMRGEPVR